MDHIAWVEKEPALLKMFGGMHGYQEMLEAFKIPAGMEAKKYRRWLGLIDGEEWDARFCSVRETNKRLCLLGCVESVVIG